MATIKCPRCGYRHFQAVAVCINCGATLPKATTTRPAARRRPQQRSQPAATTDKEKKDLVAYQRSLTETARNKAPERVRRSDSAKRFSYSIREEKEQQLTLPPHPETEATQAWQTEALSPWYDAYETDMDIVPPHPFTEGQDQSIVVHNEQTPAAVAESWQEIKLPWYFPRTQPNASGKVLIIESREEIIDYPDLFTAVGGFLVELLWSLSSSHMAHARVNERVAMTVIRVQGSDGRVIDARMRGHLRGANISLGDVISLWGNKRRGVLFFNRGYNHTTQSIISAHAGGLFFPALLIVACLVLIICIPGWIPSIIHATISSFSSIFSLFYHAKATR